MGLGEATMALATASAVLVIQIKFWGQNELSFDLSFHLSCRILGGCLFGFFKIMNPTHVESRK